MKTVEERRLMLLDLYIQWLNQFVPADEPESMFTRETFTPVEGAEWRHFSIEKVLHPGRELDEEIWVISASFGDEGGPSIIHVYWDLWNPHDPDEEWELKYMIQLFDTMASMVGAYDYRDSQAKFFINKGNSNG